MNCTRCEKTWFLNHPDEKPYKCYKPCRAQQWEDDITDVNDPKCHKCDKSCLGCNTRAKGNTSKNCDKCAPGYYNNTAKAGGAACDPCDISCIVCTGPNNN